MKIPDSRRGIVSAMIKRLPKKLKKLKTLKSRPSKTALNEFQREILRKYFVVKLMREASESHVDCGLHEGSDRKH